MSKKPKKPAAGGRGPKPAADRRGAVALDLHRAQVRAAVAEWLEKVRSVLNEVYRSASDLHREVKANPTGDVARALAGRQDELYDLAVSVSNADANASGLFMSPADPLPDPVTVARGGKDGA